MENNGGYAYGIWLLLTPQTFVPFKVNHKLHITLMSNIDCKRTAQNLYFRLVNENKIFSKIPDVIDSSSFETMKFLGYPSSALGWKVPFKNWDYLSSEMSKLYPKGNVPDIPHVSLQYYRSQDFTFVDWYHKDLKFSLDLVLVDMNDSNPQNWKIIS